MIEYIFNLGEGSGSWWKQECIIDSFLDHLLKTSVSFLSFSAWFLSQWPVFGESHVWKFPTINLLCLMCNLSFSNVNFINVGAVVFHKCLEFRSSFDRIFPLLSTNILPWILITISWESILLAIRMAAPVCFFDLFACKMFFQPLSLR